MHPCSSLNSLRRGSSRCDGRSSNHRVNGLRERLEPSAFVTADATTQCRNATRESGLVLPTRDANVGAPLRSSSRDGHHAARAQPPSSGAEGNESRAKSDSDGGTQTIVDNGGPLLYDMLDRGPISGSSTPYTTRTSIAPATTPAPRQRSPSPLPDYSKVFARFGLRSPENHYGYGRSPNDPETGYSSLEGPYNHGYRPGAGIIDPLYCPPGRMPRAHAIHGDFIGDGRMGSGRFVDRALGPQRWAGSVPEARMEREIQARVGRQGRDERVEYALERAGARLRSVEIRESRLRELLRGVGDRGPTRGSGWGGGTAGMRSSEQLRGDDVAKSLWGDDTTLVDSDEERESWRARQRR